MIQKLVSFSTLVDIRSISSCYTQLIVQLDVHLT